MGKEANSGRGWFTFVRIYGLQAPAFHGTSKLPDIESVDRGEWQVKSVEGKTLPASCINGHG